MGCSQANLRAWVFKYMKLYSCGSHNLIASKRRFKLGV